MVKLTVFTPTYDRKELLYRCYQSLKSQTNKGFIWLIIDDGSQDDTKKEVETWISETTEFEIRYIYKENGGLYTTYNTAIEAIDTELCVCIDSDDYMPGDAVEKILNFWQASGSNDIAGIVGLDYYTNGQVIGDMFPKTKTINLIDLLTGKSGIVNGDRTNVVRTELYKKVAPLIGFDGEKDFNPHYLHLQISLDYDFLVLNENLRFVEYQANGMTANIYKQYCRSPKSFAKTRLLYLSFPNTSFAFKLRHSIHYVSSCILAKKLFKGIAESPCRFLAILSLLPGALLSVYSRYKAKR